MNKFIHIVCLPVLVWTTAVFLQYIPYHYELGCFNVNAASVLAAVYTIYYIILDGFPGLLMAGFFGFVVWSSLLFQSQVEWAWAWALGAHVLSWILQFIGHDCFENNKPALVNGLFQTLMISPLFALLEILFLCGYRRKMQFKYTSPSGPINPLMGQFNS